MLSFHLARHLLLESLHSYLAKIEFESRPLPPETAVRHRQRASSSVGARAALKLAKCSCREIERVGKHRVEAKFEVEKSSPSALISTSDILDRLVYLKTCITETRDLDYKLD